MRYLLTAQPTLRNTPPHGEQWLHEVKFDGWRVQLHKHYRKVVIYSKNGHDYTRRFPFIAARLAALPTHSAVIDGELTACNERGVPDFRVLHFHERDHDLCVWAFDLLHFNDADLRNFPLVGRKLLLGRLVHKIADDWLRLSEDFSDGVKLLLAANRMGLEGIVSKRRDAPYLAGKKSDWIKVKCDDWRVANRERWRLFERR